MVNFLVHFAKGTSIKPSIIIVLLACATYMPLLILLIYYCLLWQHSTADWRPCPCDQLPSHGPTTSKPSSMGRSSHTGLHTAAGGLHLTPQPEKSVHCCHHQAAAVAFISGHLAASCTSKRIKLSCTAIAQGTKCCIALWRLCCSTHSCSKGASTGCGLSQRQH